MLKNLVAILFAFVAISAWSQDNAEPKGKWDVSATTESRTINKERWERIKNDKRFRYKKADEKIEKELPEVKEPKNFGFEKLLNAPFVKLILYLFFGGLLLYIVYLFFKNNNISFTKNIKDERVEQEAPWEDIRHFDDWQNALQKAIERKDFRLATRIYYLQTLHILHSSQLIDFADGRTNWHYVRQLDNNSFQEDFIGLTRNFDYIWYGEYQINEDQFQQLTVRFLKFHNDISQ